MVYWNTPGRATPDVLCAWVPENSAAQKLLSLQKQVHYKIAKNDIKEKYARTNYTSVLPVHTKMKSYMNILYINSSDVCVQFICEEINQPYQVADYYN